MNIGNALKVTCVGFTGGVLLRVVEMLFFFDYETGFYTDGGLMAWLCTGFVVICALFAAFMCFRARSSFGPYMPRKNSAVGVVAVLSGVALVASAVLEGLDYIKYQSTGMSSYDSVERGIIHIAFMITCFIFGLVQIYVSVGFFVGKNMLAKAPLLYLAGVIWGIVYLILVYVFYAKSSSFTENFFAVISGASTLLAVFYLCKLFSGVDEEGAAKRAFVTGIFAVILTITYSLSNLALLFLGKSYSGEIPTSVQLANLGVAVFILLFLVTFKKHSLRRQSKNSVPKSTQETSTVPKNGRRFRPN